MQQDTIIATIFEDIEKLNKNLIRRIEYSSDVFKEVSNPELIHNRLLFGLLSKTKDILVNDFNNKDTNYNLDYDEFNLAAENDVSLADIIEILSEYRYELITYIQDYCQPYKEAIDCNQVSNKILRLFDEVIRLTTRDYNSKHIGQVESIRVELLNLSAPIVPIKNNISIIPLIGSFTEERTQAILNETIPKIAEEKIEKLIVDFSGIYSLDTYITSRLMEIFLTVKLLGIHPILTGIRPEMAQTIVQLGIDLNDYEIAGSVQTALMNH